jgi:geranylgeranyl diphosphate synthase, type I
VLEYFLKTKKKVRDAIAGVLAGEGAVYAQVSSDLGADAAEKIDEFSSRGKMLRGNMVRLGYELSKGTPPSGDDERCVDLAGAAMELFQSGLLVHDDIMDRDRVRRGSPTVHVGYETALESGGYDDPPHNGASLGICSGDLAFFAAFRVLATLPTDASTSRALMSIASRELSLVGVAQMQDVANGAIKPDSANPFRDAACEPLEEDILKLYRYKTGRYTFSLPLALGATLAGAGDETRTALEEAGEDLGILFQLKDDELGLFADEAELGKPVGADIREDKKTLYRLRLFEKADHKTADRLRSMFGNHEPGMIDAGFVRSTIERLGIREELAAMMRRYADAAGNKIANLAATATSEASTAFRELLAYSLERRS